MKTHFRPIINLLTITVLCLSAAGINARETTRVSVSSSGEQAQAYSGYTEPSLSADGRFVAFGSSASNLVPGDTNNSHDIFVHDRLTGQTGRVSVSSSGEQANGWSSDPSLSADGRFVAFESYYASNLVPGDTNKRTDIFVHDRLSGQTERVSVSSGGRPANNHSHYPSLSADGRFVAFQSLASNLVPGDTNSNRDIFVHDRLTGQTGRVSVTSSGEQANGVSSYATPSLSADGRFVAFLSGDTNLVPGDSNDTDDIFVHDRLTGQTGRVNVSSGGEQADGSSYTAPSLSADGRLVAFGSSASNLVPGDTNNSHDIFVHDRLTGQTGRVSVSSDGEQANGYSYGAASSLSADGRFVAFCSEASNLVPGDSNDTGDIFVHDRLTGQTERVSVSSGGRQVKRYSYYSSLSADGRFVAFYSNASKLVPGDTNDKGDIFVHDRRLNRAYQADVGVSLTRQPDSLARLGQGRFVYTVTNHSPDPAKAVRIVHSVTHGKVASFNPSQGHCRRYATLSLCRFGELPPGASLTLELDVKALKAAPLSQYLSVSSPKKDPAPGNNTVSVETPVTP